MKKLMILFLLSFLLFVFFSCSSAKNEPPDLIFEEIQTSYGSLPPGLFFDSYAREWEEFYLDRDVIENIFGSEKEYKESVASAYLYLSASLSSYEEIFVLECYTSDKARCMAAAFLERDRKLATLEDVKLEAQILCDGRTVVYCRLSDSSRAKSAIRKLES